MHVDHFVWATNCHRLLLRFIEEFYQFIAECIERIIILHWLAICWIYIPFTIYDVNARAKVFLLCLSMVFFVACMHHVIYAHLRDYSSPIEFSVQVNVFTYLNPKSDYSQRYLSAQLLLQARVRQTAGILSGFGIQSYDLNLNEKKYCANNNICSNVSKKNVQP